MRPTIFGRKLGMTRITDEHGVVHPVTVIQAGPCVVLQVKNAETDGYNALQVGFGDVKPHRSTKALIGHAGKAATGPKRFVREIRLDEAPTQQPGDVLTVEMFGGDAVKFCDVVGVTKGKGTMGVMRRYGFGGMGASHGTERKHRSPGSIGGGAPRGHGRAVKKGKRMAGHTGDVRRTLQNQRLVGVDVEDNLLLVRGGVPGPDGGFVIVRQSKKRG
ncbi:MAG: 50S ribosomal protein L3 [Phycisphaerales bacterium]|nr:50S ribosomal protein L3 [Phycisphaerales bacterium]